MVLQAIIIRPAANELILPLCAGADYAARGEVATLCRGSRLQVTVPIAGGSEGSEEDCVMV